MDVFLNKLLSFIDVILDNIDSFIIVIPNNILITSISIILLFFLLLIYELYKLKNKKILKKDELLNNELIKLEKNLKDLKELYVNGHIDVNTYKEKTKELTGI